MGCGQRLIFTTALLLLLQDRMQINLIVGREDELKDDDKTNEGRLSVVKPKRNVQFTFVHQQGKHHKTQERVHLHHNTTKLTHCTARTCICYNIYYNIKLTQKTKARFWWQPMTSGLETERANSRISR